MKIDKVFALAVAVIVTVSTATLAGDKVQFVSSYLAGVVTLAALIFCDED